ncbi:MAG: hypothetical protein KAU14_01675 [Thermoplasmata archaeon]|nr:hypothetical protein [Thermoplasmata archaeon]
MRLREINERAWRLAISALYNERGRLLPYSSGQIRKALEAAKRDDFPGIFRTIKEDYSPPEDKRFLTRFNEAFLEGLMKTAEGMEKRDVYQMLLYVLWDLEAVKNLHGDERMLRAMWEAEGVQDGDGLARLLEEKSRGGEQKRDYSHDGRGGGQGRNQRGPRRNKRPWEDLRPDYWKDRR